MKFAVEMAMGTMKNTSFVNIGSGIQNLIRRDTRKHIS
jgi:hypothetical protein